MLSFLLVEPVTRASTLYRVYTTFCLVKQQIFKTILEQKATKKKGKILSFWVLQAQRIRDPPLVIFL